MYLDNIIPKIEDLTTTRKKATLLPYTCLLSLRNRLLGGLDQLAMTPRLFSRAVSPPFRDIRRDKSDQLLTH
jgi:hypothetical protein